MLLTYDYLDETLSSIIIKLVATRGTCFGKNIVIELSRSKCLVIKDGLVIIIAPPIKRCSVDSEHIIRFHVWTENFCSFFPPKVAFSNLSGIVWTRPQPCSSDRLHNVAVKLT